LQVFRDRHLEAFEKHDSMVVIITSTGVEM
jgi:hypothetical protein